MPSIRPIIAEIAAPTTSGTATTVSSADIVRAVNTTTSPHLLTILDESDNIIGSMTLTGNQTEYIKKRELDKIYAANAGIRLVRTTYPVT